VDAKEGGLYASRDGGATWARVSSESRIWGRGWYFGAVTVDPKNPDVVYVCNTGIHRSTDGGKTFAPFKGAPMLTWTGEIGRVLSATLEGGAKVAGFDIVIPTSIELSEIPFGEGVLGDRVRGFDRDFLRALAGAASNGKVVLGEILLGNQPVRPSPGQRIAVRQQQNIRPLNVHSDSDDIVRRLPLSFTINEAKVPSMAIELASRALGAAPEFDDRGRLTLAGYRVPGRVPNTMTLNFEGGADDIPTFSFADLRACAVKNDKDYFRRWFAGKVVIFGSVLDIEDRRHRNPEPFPAG